MKGGAGRNHQLRLVFKPPTAWDRTPQSEKQLWVGRAGGTPVRLDVFSFAASLSLEEQLHFFQDDSQS